MGLPWNNGDVGDDCGFVEFFFASLVWTSQFLVLMSMENLHDSHVQRRLLGVARFNKRCFVCYFGFFCSTKTHAFGHVVSTVVEQNEVYCDDSVVYSLNSFCSSIFS